ncbi:MAG: SRPBCC domain-containing protein, partial [Pedobacter sp.]
SKTKNMDFKVGGSRFYAMVGPEGEEHLAIQQFTAIQPKSNFKYSNAFADENATPNLPGSEWNLNFRAENGITTVTISIYNDSLERMEQMLEMGFKEGFTMTLNELDHLLLATKKS